MNGKIAGIVILLSAIIAGGALYYLQIYGFYQTLPANSVTVRLLEAGSLEPQEIETTNLRAIDAQSSPIRFRACFDVTAPLGMLEETYALAPGVLPRNAPGWFDCFDAKAIGDALEAGKARTFLGQKNIAFGVDRIVAITSDGKGYIWHELNDCGEKSYDGTIVGEECPRLPETN